MDNSKRTLIAALCIFLSAGTVVGARDRFPKIAASTDVAWLEQIASSTGATVEGVETSGTLGGHAKDARTEAYARLGALGSPEALAAIHRIEAHARTVERHVEVKPSSVWIHPTWHWEDPLVEATAEARDAEGAPYIITRIGPMGLGHGLYLLPPEAPENAPRRPMLLPSPVPPSLMTEIELAVKGDSLRLTYHLRVVQRPPDIKESRNLTTDSAGRVVWTVDIAEILKDSDNDGWTDAEEQRMQLDPANPDSDSDGIVDGRDGCPDYPMPAESEQDEEAQILQRAFFATYGISRSRQLIQINPKSRKLHFWGYPGPIIFNENAREPNWLGFPVTYVLSKRNDTEAVVSLQDNAGVQEVTLHKVSGEWVVVRRRLVGVA